MSDEFSSEILALSAKRRKTALSILDELRLFERWERFGRPVLVGAVAYDLAYDADIDMEIYCPELKITDGFQVLSECAAGSNRVIGIAFENHLEDADDALYWKIQYRDTEGTVWKIDMWSARSDYALPRSETIVGPMKRVLNDELREAILTLKDSRSKDASLACISIDLYRAVIEDGVRDADSFRRWLETHTTGELTGWMPRI